jgi:hypothetical protein
MTFVRARTYSYIPGAINFLMKNFRKGERLRISLGIGGIRTSAR